MSNIELITGDPLVKIITLSKITAAGEATFNIPTTGAPVTVAVVSSDHARRLTDNAVLSSSTPGSDWSASKIVVEIPKEQTEAIDEFGFALLEIQVDDGGEITWFHGVTIINGIID